MERTQETTMQEEGLTAQIRDLQDKLSRAHENMKSQTKAINAYDREKQDFEVSFKD